MKRWTVAALATGVCLGVMQVGTGAASASTGMTRWASPHGSGTACTWATPCALTEAVSGAAAGDTVRAMAGRYAVNGITITKRLMLRGEEGAVIDATTTSPTTASARGIIITGAGAAGSTVTGFTVENAFEEGILAMNTSNLTISRNVVKDNDQGVSGQSFDECMGSGPIPGDCGEGLHLMTVMGSIVANNVVRDNAGGILLTDELGPTANNLITRNHVHDNALDCGITIAGHNPNAINATTGARQPTMGGIYANRISNNVSNHNGIKGEGAGILLASGAPFGGVYDNWVTGNTAVGNGLSGVTIHEHFASDLNNNVVENNRLTHDNIDGDRDFNPADTQTTGILVASGPTPAPLPPPLPITVVIRGNLITHVHTGIWLLNASGSIRGNHFVDVRVPIETH